MVRGLGPGWRVSSKDVASSDDEAVGWFFENALDIFLVCTDGLIERANPAWNAFAGWTEDETQGRRLLEFVHPDDGVVVDTALEQLATLGLSDCEHRPRTADGDWRWVRSRVKRFNARRLLVAPQEDNPTNRLVATPMLSDPGATVETAEDGAQGVACAQTGAYDLIFMDIQMPVMDGGQPTRQIRALPGAVGKTPIVATTANVLEPFPI